MPILRRGDPDFPREVLLGPEPPEQLWALGDLSLLSRPMVSIIGSRHPTPYGITVAYQAAKALAEQGAVIVSGMALGLDARAHQGALDAGGGTIAVLGCGIDVDYPRPNLRLLNEVRQRGLVLTEFEPGTHPTRFSFPRRNRIIAALGRCLLVVEGEIKGGTASTIAWAGENKQLFAVPGQIDNPMAGSPNLALQHGAAAYLHPNDVLSFLGLPLKTRTDSSGVVVALARDEARARRAQLSHAEAELFDLVTRQPVHVDTLGQRSGLAPGLLLAALSSLELQGLVRQLPGKHFALAS